MSPSRPLSTWRYLFMILLIGWGLRLGFVCWLQERLDRSEAEFLISGDAEGYWELARRINDGRDFAIHTPPRYVHRMPGLPAVLAMSIKLFGESLFAARLFLATWGAFSCWLVFILGQRLHSPRVGFIAAGLAAISPASIGFAGLILSETLFGVTLLLFAICLDALLKSSPIAFELDVADPEGERILGKFPLQTCGLSVLTGGVIAAGVYLKPSWILAGPLCALVLLVWQRPRLLSLASGALILCGLFLALLPWGIRNQQVSGHFKLTTFWMGPSLYDGLNPQATGESNMQFFDQDRLTSSFSEYEVDQEYQWRALQFARENPTRVIQLAFVKLWRYWKPWPNAAQFDRPAIHFLLCLYTVPVFMAACAGAWSVRHEYWTIVICAGPIFYFSSLHMVFVSSLRYRLPAEASLLVLSAIGIVAISSKFKRRSENTDS